ncbi:TPA: hypothetical protein ACKJ22_002148, partial [Neisseria gonorrhoeae]
NQLVQAVFYFSYDLKSTVNPSCFSNRLQPQNLPQSAPSPARGRAGERAFSELRQSFPNSLSLLKYKPCGLLPSL